MREWTRCAVVAAACAVTLVEASGAPAGAGALHFERFGAREGLRVETIVALYQDRTGFIWIGTRDGLVLFDGASFRTFHHEPGRATSIADNDVRTVFEDHDGNLWVGTNTAGLDRLDRRTWTFSHYRHDSANPRSLSHDSVYALAEDGGGRLWVGTQDGLNRWDARTGGFERVDLGPEKVPASEYVFALHVDPTGALWIASVGGGLGRRDPASGRFTWFRHADGDPSSLASNLVFAVLTDRGGGTWVGTRMGLARWIRGTRAFEHARDGGRPNDWYVTALAQGDGSTIWVGTLAGLIEFDAATNENRRHEHRTDAERASSAGRVIALLVDRSGSLWAGTWAEGLNHVRRPTRLFGVIQAERTSGLTYTDASAVLEDHAGRLWIGTFGGGLHRRDPGRPGFAHYPDPAEDPLRGIDHGVQRLYEDRAGRVWVGTVGALARIDPGEGGITTYRHDAHDPHSIGAGFVTAIAEDAARRLWVGTGGGGLCRLREDGRGFDCFVNAAGDASSLSDDYVSAIVEDRAGRLWVGTRSAGLNLFDRATGRFTRFEPVESDASSLGHRTVTALYEDRGGTLWVATAGGGLERVVEVQGRIGFEHVTDPGGLANDNVASLAEADDGSLWVATRGGLTHVDPQRRVVQNFDTGDGLPSLLFNGAAVSVGRELIRFGSVGGVVEIPRTMRLEPAPPSPTVVTSIRTLRGPVAAERPVWELPRVDIPYGEILSLDFAVLDYREPVRHRFSYRLRPGEPWVQLGPRRELTFTGLEPGEYDVAVRGCNAAGVWSDASPLHLRIVPPFWRTTWFRALLVTGAGALVLVAHRVRTSALERRNRVLTALRSQLEAALGESRGKEEQRREAFERLRALSHRLEQAKEEERRHIARELHDEMGQVLTAAKITIDLATRGKQVTLDDMQEVGQLLDQIIERVRDISQGLRPPLLDEAGLVPALAGYLEAQARRSGVGIALEARPDPGRFAPDIEITAFRIVQEAVTNVLRHAGATHVVVRVRLTGSVLELSVADDGRGFDVEEALARAARGRHLGLLGIRERAEMLGGRVELRSAPGQGTEVHVEVDTEAVR